MTNKEIQTLAQSLVDLEIEKRRIEKEKELVKLDLWKNARNGIKCKGGMVYWVNPRDEMRFNKAKLKEILSDEGLDEQKIDDIINRSKDLIHLDANIYIKIS